MPVSLIDAFTRHQVYLEGYKDGLDGRLDPILREMYPELQAALNNAQFDRLNDLTRRELNRLIRTIQKLQLRRNDAFRSNILTELRAFAHADLQLNRNIMESTEETKIEDAYDEKLGLATLGLLALRNNRKGRARLWALISNSIDPASGLTAKQAINDYLRYINKNVKSLLNQGFANGWTVAETMAAIFGTRRNRFRDGFVWRARRAGSAMLHTVVQHISSITQAGVASVFYRYYEWVAVLDENTTKICRFRNGRIYRYGKGPLPPAHYRCRSRAVPVRKGNNYNNIPDTFYGWLKLQPAGVQNDIIGVALASGLRTGKIKVEKLGKFRSRSKLTLEQFLAKFRFIILT